MTLGQANLELQMRLRDELASSTKPISYGTLARDLDVPGPGAIARVTAALEALMREDSAAGRPFIAAMCEGKLSGGLPALGFFLMAAELGRYHGPHTGADAVAFVEAERAKLLGR
jgi:hypothetical protein